MSAPVKCTWGGCGRDAVTRHRLAWPQGLDGASSRYVAIDAQPRCSDCAWVETRWAARCCEMAVEGRRHEDGSPLTGVEILVESLHPIDLTGAFPGDVVSGSYADDFHADDGMGGGVEFIGRIEKIWDSGLVDIQLDGAIEIRMADRSGITPTWRYERRRVNRVSVGVGTRLTLVQSCSMPTKHTGNGWVIDESSALASQAVSS